MRKKDNPRYLRKLLRQCLDFWASPDVQDMPHIEFFDEVNRASNWRDRGNGCSTKKRNDG